MILRIILKALLVVSCAIIFLKITYELIINYHYKKVVVCVSDETVGESKMNMPIIAICAQNPFRGEIKPLYTRSDYMSNAINATKDILKDVRIYGRGDSSQKSEEEYVKKGNHLVDIEDLLTKDGHCSMVKFKEKVKGGNNYLDCYLVKNNLSISFQLFVTDRVDLFLDEEKLSSIYVLNEEEQIYMHYYPFLMNAKKIDTSADVWVTQARLYLEKTIDYVGNDCNGDDGYSKKGNLAVNP